MLACQPNLRFYTIFGVRAWVRLSTRYCIANLWPRVKIDLHFLVYLRLTLNLQNCRTRRTLRKVRKGWSYAKSILSLRVGGHEPWVANWPLAETLRAVSVNLCSSKGTIRIWGSHRPYFYRNNFQPLFKINTAKVAEDFTEKTSGVYTWFTQFLSSDQTHLGTAEFISTSSFLKTNDPKQRTSTAQVAFRS